MWIPPEPVTSVRGLEAKQVRPLMEVTLPGYTSSSTSGSSQASGSSSRPKELHDRLQLGTRYDSILRTAENTRGCGPLTHRGSLIRVLTRIQSHWQTGVLSFSGAATPQMLASLEMLDMVKMYTVTLTMGTNDVSRGDSRKVMRLHEKMSCILEELRFQMDPAIPTICTIPYNMKADQHAMEMNEKVRNINEIIRQIQQRSVLPVRLLDVAHMMERSFTYDAFSDGIHFDRPKAVEWLNGVFQRHINTLEADLLQLAQFTFGPTPVPPFFATRSLSNRLGMRVDSRDRSRSSRTRLPGST